MKIHQLLSGLNVILTNEERQFVNQHLGPVKLTSLDDRNQWVAQNLVRKGIYTISNDNITMVKK